LADAQLDAERNRRERRMDDVAEVLNLEPTPNDMPKQTRPWLDDAKDMLREHFSCRYRMMPVYDRAVTL